MTKRINGRQRGTDFADNAYDRDMEQWKLADYLARRVCDRASGRMHDECLRNYPHDTYFVGNLRYQDDEPDPHTTQDAFDEMHTKLAPVAFGADMRLKVSGDEVEIVTTVEWSAYYRIFPTLDQQRGQQGGISNSEPIASTTGVVGSLDGTTGIVANADDEDERTLLQQQERDELQAEQESPEIVESTHDRQTERRVQDDSLFVRFRKVKCRAEGSIVLH